MLELPGSLAVQLAEVVRHHSGGQTEHQARFYNKKYPETGPTKELRNKSPHLNLVRSELALVRLEIFRKNSSSSLSSR